jgi:hypothetical protein
MFRIFVSIDCVKLNKYILELSIYLSTYLLSIYNAIVLSIELILRKKRLVSLYNLDLTIVIKICLIITYWTLFPYKKKIGLY